MPRKPRIHFPAAVYHIMLRGNAGEPIFYDDGDRYRLFLLLQYGVESFHCRIHAFCLMSNHLHLVLQVDDVPLSRIMQNLSQRYTTWINRTRQRTGHVFQGRFKALLIDADAYLLELVRYVHLNPVRAGIVTAVEDYPWTGHRCFLGREPLPWLTTDVVLAMLAAEKRKARALYAAFVQDGLGEGKRGEFHLGTCEGRILGDDTFADEILSKAQQRQGSVYTLDEVIDAACAQFRCEPATLHQPGKVRPMTAARALAAAVVQASPHLRLTDLAMGLGRDVSALGKAAQRLTSDEEGRAVIAGMVARLQSAGMRMQEQNQSQEILWRRFSNG